LDGNYEEEVENISERSSEPLNAAKRRWNYWDGFYWNWAILHLGSLIQVSSKRSY